MARPKKPKLGRPSAGLDGLVRVRCSPHLLELAEAAAKAQGVTASEWWRRAALQALAQGNAQARVKELEQRLDLAEDALMGEDL